MSRTALGWAGPERRARDRTPPPLSRIIGYARVRPNATRLVQRLTAGVWYPVRDRNPQELRSAPLQGYVWVEVFERLEHIWLEHVEVRLGGKPDSAGF